MQSQYRLKTLITPFPNPIFLISSAPPTPPPQKTKASPSIFSSLISSQAACPCALALAVSQDALLTSGLTHKVPKVVITVLDILIQIFS